MQPANGLEDPSWARAVIKEEDELRILSCCPSRNKAKQQVIANILASGFLVDHIKRALDLAAERPFIRTLDLVLAIHQV